MTSSSEPRRRLRVLFAMRNYWYVRHFEPVIAALAAAGHEVQLLAERPTNEKAEDWSDAAAALAAHVPGLSYATAPRADEDVWYDLRVMLRLGLDYLRFTAPEYRTLEQMVARARARTPYWLRRVADSAPGRSARGRQVLAALLGAAERVVPPDPALASDLAERRPDVVVVTPLVELGSEQADVVRVAQRLGIPSVLCTGSWDHLSSKGLIRALPDRVIVWNETQKNEAVAMHGVPPAVIEVTGAQCFDQWFARQPSTGRAEFCARVGLRADSPYVIYACSALFEGSPDEAGLVSEWIAQLRRHPRLRAVGVLIRPHPKRAAEMAAFTAGLEQVAVWPRSGTAPFAADAQAEYFDSLFHAAAVVGLNTSALIEGGIVGRPVLTILHPDYTGNQEGTLHFRYLLDGGLLLAARSIEEHLDLLARAIAGPEGGANDAFVRAFVRPHGLEEPATPRVVASIEAAAAGRRAPSGETAGVRLGRTLLWPVARATSGRFAEQVGRARRRKVEDEERARRLAVLAVKRQRIRATRAAERARIREERDSRRAREREEALARRAAERLAVVAQREAERAERERAARAAQEARQRAKAERIEQHRRSKRAAAGKS